MTPPDGTEAEARAIVAEWMAMSDLDISDPVLVQSAGDLQTSIATALRARTAERDEGDALAVARAHAAMWKGERDRLTAERDEARSGWEQCRGLLRLNAEAVGELKAERDRLAERLKNVSGYALHTPLCAILGIDDDYPCTCGLAAALQGGRDG